MFSHAVAAIISKLRRVDVHTRCAVTLQKRDQMQRHRIVYGSIRLGGLLYTPVEEFYFAEMRTPTQISRCGSCEKFRNTSPH
jgi:hypothetical protein